MMGKSQLLAAEMAARFLTVLPPSLAVRAVVFCVNVYDGGRDLGGSAAASILDDVDDRSAIDRLETAVSAILNGVQDVVSEAIRQEWPQLPNGGMAIPDTRCDDHELALWFGDEREPVLRLAPIATAPYVQ